MTTITAAAIQAEPVILDRDATLEKAVSLIGRARDEHAADLCVFPEAFVTAYPQWAHNAPLEHPKHKAAFARLAKNAVRVPDDLDAVAAAAKDAGSTVVLGVNERVDETPGTLYNTLAVFGRDGSFLGKHRKLVPTHHERTIWGYGDGDTLTTFRDGALNVGGLVCWNNYMPLARHALYAQGLNVWVAPTADDRAQWQDAMRFIAQESRSYVVGVCLIQRKSSFPEDWELAGDGSWEAEAEWNERGGSCIVAPNGEYLAEPVFEKEAIITAELDLDAIVAERHTFDPVGHYGRGDVLRLSVHRNGSAPTDGRGRSVQRKVATGQS